MMPRFLRHRRGFNEVEQRTVRVTQSPIDTVTHRHTRRTEIISLGNGVALLDSLESNR